MKTFQLLYVSKPVKEFSSNEVQEIVNKAIDHNSKNNITGILLFKSGLFLQLLEGEKNKVEVLFSKIEKDPRHSNIIKILSEEKNDRIFTDWAMGFHEVSDLDIKQVNDILSWNKLISAAKDIDNHLILHMLSRFKSNLKK